MPVENHRGRRPAGVRRVVELLTVALVTAAVIVVYIRMGRSTVKSSADKTRPAVDDRGPVGISVATSNTPTTATPNLNATTTVEIAVPNSGSLNAAVVQTEPGSGALPFVLNPRDRSRGAEENGWLLNHKYSADDVTNGTGFIAGDTGIHNTNTDRRINDGDDPAYSQTQEWSTERDDDRPVAGDGQGYGKDPAEPNYPALVYGPSYYRPPEIRIISDHQTPNTDYFASPNTDHHHYQPPGGTRYRPRPPLNTRYRQPPAKSTIIRYPVPSGSPPKIVIPVTNKSAFDWETVIGVLALFKFGLLKMKAFGVIKLLLLLLFKVKFLLGIVLFKFLLLLKVTKFFKLLLVPQFIVLLGLPVVTALLSPFALATIFSIPAKIINMFKYPANLTAPMMQVSMLPMLSLPAIPATLPSILPAVTVPSTNQVVASSGMLSRPMNSMEALGDLTNFPLRPDRLPINTKYLDALPYTKAVRPGNLSPGPAVNNKRRTQIYLSKNGNLNSPHSWSNESSSPSTNPNSPDVARDVLNTDSCAERIACRLAASERAGLITPPRMDWIFNSTSNVTNLGSYFKTYNDVKNEILQTNSSAPDITYWTTWCSERYNCNNTKV